jgi:hypothetical protein
VVLYGYETWFQALKYEDRLTVRENTVLRRIFGTKGDKVIGEQLFATFRSYKNMDTFIYIYVRNMNCTAGKHTPIKLYLITNQREIIYVVFTKTYNLSCLG